MPTVVTKTVAPSGGDYTSLSAAITGELTARAGLVARDEQLVIECAAFTDTTIVEIDGFTTDATRNIIVRAAAGAEHDGVPGAGYKLVAALNFGGVLEALQEYVEFHGIEVENTSDRFSYGLRLQRGNSVVKDVICSGAAAAGFFAAVGLPLKQFINCLAVSCNIGLGNNNDNVEFLNCTAVNCTTGFAGHFYGGSVKLTNCVAFDCGTDFLPGAEPGSANNASEDATAPGTSSVTSITSGAFEDYAGGDYTPAAGGALDDAGTDLSAFFTDDITGATRTQWDIGAFGIVSAAPTAVEAPSPLQQLSNQFSTIAASRLNGVLQ